MGTLDDWSSKALSVERRGDGGRVGLLWLDRPEARNAMGPDLFADLPRAMAALGEDDAVRVVVVAARGRDFTVGLDLKAMLGGSLAAEGEGSAGASMAARATTARQGILRLQGSITSVADCPKPVIAALHGWCIGGGVDLASACDIRLASADTRMSVRETRMAIVADLGSLQRLPGIVGRGQVAELAYTGKDIDADHALRIGLVNDVLADPESTVEAAMSLAAEIAANSPLVVQGTKAVLRAGEGRRVAEGLDFVAAWNAGFLPSDDLKEALAAFLQKRPPEFRGT